MYAFSQDVPIEEGIYRRISEKIGSQPLEGQLLHLVVRRPEGGLRYIDVWESREAFSRAVDEFIHPAVHSTLAEIGIRPQGEPASTELDVVDVLGHLTASVT